MVDTIRVVRVIEYVGSRKWVEGCVARSVSGIVICGEGQYIAGATLLAPVREVNELLLVAKSGQHEERRARIEKGIY